MQMMSVSGHLNYNVVNLNYPLFDGASYAPTGRNNADNVWVWKVVRKRDELLIWFRVFYFHASLAFAYLCFRR